MRKVWEPAMLDNHPRLGWQNAPTPVSVLNGLMKNYDASWIGCKRDDLCSSLYGGIKVRKLDYLLGASPYAESKSLSSMGAIGSGHIVACCAAAKTLKKKFIAHLFWEPISQGVLDNLAYTATYSHKICYYPSRIILALNNPALFLDYSMDGSSVIPPGATCAAGILGMVRAGVELAVQVRNAEILCPKRIYAALGTGGSVAGLAIGVALGGIQTEIHAVSAVEYMLSTRYRLNRLISDTQKLLINLGHKDAGKITPAKIIINRTQLGNGYGCPTKASLAAVSTMKQLGIDIEPIYTGKVLAAMLEDLEQGLRVPVLFWNSMRRSLPKPNDKYMNHLPAQLKKKLLEQTRNN